MHGMITRKGNFRQEQIFWACSPIMENSKDLKEISRRNVLTNGLLGTYPFISSSICDQDGIFIGTNIYNHSIILMDRFNKEKYKNANMCIFGTSGAGKSFYIKLLILRHRLFQLDQYIIDPEREYDKVCNYLNGTLIKIGPTSETYINIFDIREESIEEGKGYLATKIGKLRGFFYLIFGEIEEEKMAIIEEKVIQIYFNKGITFEDESLYKKDEISGKFIFKESKEMPKLEDLYNSFDSVETKHLRTKLYPFVYGSLKFLNEYTNIELKNKLIAVMNNMMSSDCTQEEINGFLNIILDTYTLNYPNHMKRKNTSVKKEFVNALASFVSYDAFIADIISILATLRNDKRDPDRYEQLANEVEEYLINNYNKNITSDVLSKEFGFVPSYISRLFKRQKGVSPNEYVTKYRIEKAKKLIEENNDLRIKDIADAVGFKESYYFSKTFKRETGMWPTEYSARDK